MINRDYCSGCAHEHDCKTIYKAIGESKGPSVTGKVLLAFVVPIFVFITILAIAEAVFSKVAWPGWVEIVIEGVAASAASVLTAWVAGIGQRRQAAGSGPCQSKEQTYEDER